MRSDCIRMEVSEGELLANVDARTRLLEKISPIQKIRNAKLSFEEVSEDVSVSATPLRFSWSDLDVSQESVQGEQLTGGDEIC